MQRKRLHSALRRAAIVGLIVAGGMFSLSSSALPVPPVGGSGWLIYTYYALDENSGGYVPVGMRYQGGCPGPQPHDWGVKTPRFDYKYVSCGQN